MNSTGSKITEYFRRRSPVNRSIRNLTLVLAVALFYGVIFIPLHFFWGEGVSLLAIIPVALCGWFFGPVIGIITGLGMMAFNLLLWAQAGVLNYQWSFIAWLILNLVTFGIVGYISGRYRELRYARLSQVQGKKENTSGSNISRENKTSEVEVKLAPLIDFIPNPGLAVDQQSQIIAWNPAIERLTGIPAKQVLGIKTKRVGAMAFGENHPMLVDFILDKSRNLEKELPTAKWENQGLQMEAFFPEFKPGGAYLSFMAQPLYNQDGIHVGAVEFLQDVTEARLAQEQKSIWEQKEGITGLFTLNYFEKEISKLEHQENFPHSIILLRLKTRSISKSSGSERTEELLKRVAASIQSTFRFSDTIAYIGERDFAILVPKTDAGTVEHLAERLRKSLSLHASSRYEPPLLFNVVAVTSLITGTLLETFQQGRQLVDEE